MRAAVFLGLLAITAVLPARAQVAVDVASTAASPISDMDAVVVTGVQPGPGMWKVSKGDHVMWVLGTQSPLPKQMQWHSPEVEAAITQSQELLDQPGLNIGISKGGVVRALFAVPTLLKVRKLPDGQRLQDVLPPELYLRWSQLKPRYLGRDQDAEHLRPMFAAQALHHAAISQTGLESGDIAQSVADLAKRSALKITPTSLSATLTKPKALAKSLIDLPMDDIACFRATLDKLDTDVAMTAARANAWAVGDVAEMARLNGQVDVDSCFKAVTETEAMRSLGLDDAETKIAAKWLQAAEAALARNQSSFALLSVPHLLSTRSYLATLAARGYTVEAPQ